MPKQDNIYIIDMTTSTPTLAKKIYEEAKKKEIFVSDRTRFWWRYRGKKGKSINHGRWR